MYVLVHLFGKVFLFSCGLGSCMMSIVMLLWSSWVVSMAQCIACVVGSFVGRFSMPWCFHLFLNARPFKPNILVFRIW